MTSLETEIQEAETKAIDSLARYKFAMFGYWAGIWVHLNRIEGKRRPNPFGELVRAARALRDAEEQPKVYYRNRYQHCTCHWETGGEGNEEKDALDICSLCGIEVRPYRSIKVADYSKTS